MNHFLSRIESKLCIMGSGTCLILMVFTIITSVLGRYLLHTDLIPGSFNIIERILFPTLVFCAVPITYREGMFPRVTYFRSKFSGRLASFFDLLCLCLETALYLVIVSYTFRFAWQAVIESRTMQIGSETWLLWPILLLVPTIFLLVLLNTLVDIYVRLWPGKPEQ